VFSPLRVDDFFYRNSVVMTSLI